MTMSATYSPEDNKLRLYASARLDAETYAKVKAAGFKWAPKQELFVAPKWSPAREDLLLELCDEIEDEDYSPEERAADRAERFAGYREKRTAEAIGHADTFDAGPAAFGHQSRARAERQAARHDRQRGRACSQWSKAEYWQQRTAGVIANALHKSDPSTRRGRIVTLETELRRYCPTARWKEHYELRLSYERAMLANEGGTAADIEMVVGGFVGKYQIEKVNKSAATGKVVSVAVRPTPGARFTKLINIQRLGENVYRAPTEQELADFHAATKQRKAEEKSERKPTPSLINPTDADAERLQAIWNEKARRRCKSLKEDSKVRRMTQAEYSARSKGGSGPCEAVEIDERGFEISSYRDNPLSVCCFKVRRGSGSRELYGAYAVIVLTDKPQKPLPWEAMADVCETLPSEESVYETLPELVEVCAKAWHWDAGDDGKKLIQEARYIGWAYYSSESQFGLTDAGKAAWDRYQAEHAATAEMAPAGLLF